MTLYLNVCWQFCKSIELNFEYIYQLEYLSTVESLLSDIQRATSNDPLCYVDETLQEATDGAVVIHLEVNDI